MQGNRSMKYRIYVERGHIGGKTDVPSKARFENLGDHIQTDEDNSSAVQNLEIKRESKISRLFNISRCSQKMFKSGNCDKFNFLSMTPCMV